MSLRVDPRLLLVDRSVRPHGPMDFVADLVSGCPVEAQGRYVIAQWSPPPGQAFLCKAMACYAQERINVGLATETIRTLAPQDASTFFLFEPQVGRAAPFDTRADYALAHTAASANDRDRQAVKGIGHVTLNAWTDVQVAAQNPLWTFVVPSGSELRVVFSIVPMPAVGGLPAGGQYGVGGAGGTRRVDRAGVMVMGLLAPQQVLSELEQRVDAWPGP